MKIKILIAGLFGFILNFVVLYSQAFTEQTGITLTGISPGKVAWGDYNNDGYLDILLSGSDISKVYKNNGNNTFTEQAGIVLTGISLHYGSVEWGDYDNDGDLDILLTGENISWINIAKVYKNNGNNTFTEQAGIVLPGIMDGNAAWGDYDNDGDLDILLSGGLMSGNTSKIFKNNGNNTFTEQTGITLPGISTCSNAWGDYDNDGDLDIILTGYSTSLGDITKIYENNGNNTFTEQTSISLTGLRSGNVAWGDYNNDGYLDILLTGTTDGSNGVAKIYKNNGNGTFTEQTGITLTGIFWGSAIWGDYDNDGYLDILLTGYSGTPTCKIYKNNANGTFTEQTGITLTPVSNSSQAWCDYDNDGDLDILLTGNASGAVSKIFKNNSATVNNAPTAPSNLSSELINSKIWFKWYRSSDDHTPAKGLSYNIRIGSTPGDSNIISSMSSSNGRRRIATFGNAMLDTSWYLDISNYKVGKYYWSVQAIDNSFKGGAFATENDFIVPYLFRKQKDTTLLCGVSVQLNDSVVNKGILPLTYSWSPVTGLNNPNISNPVAKPKKTTSYIVTVTDGTITCKDTVVVKVNPLPAPALCIITTQQSTNKYMVVWERLNDKRIAGYKIKRTQTTSKYDSIGYVSQDSISVFVDKNSDFSKAVRYAISIIDSCGNETELGAYQQPILLRANAGTSHQANIEWNKYVDSSGIFKPAMYYVYKSKDKITWNQLDSVPDNINPTLTKIDTSYDGTTTYYQVSVSKPTACAPAVLKAESGPYTQSLSNIVEYKVSRLDAENAMQATVYPNPFSETLTISFKLEQNSDALIEIINATGQKTAEFSYKDLAAGTQQIQLSAAAMNITEGMCYIKIVANEKTSVIKVNHIK